LQAAESNDSAMQAGTSMAHSGIFRPPNQHPKPHKNNLHKQKTIQKHHIKNAQTSVAKQQGADISSLGIRDLNNNWIH
jgi:hypothetical protein